MIVFLILLSIGLTVFQVVNNNQREFAVIEVFRDIKQGEVIEQGDLGLVYRLEKAPLGAVQKTEDAIGKVALVDLSKGTLAMSSYFEMPVQSDVPKGYAKTAIKLLPEEAICFTSDLESDVDVYFVSDGGSVEVLGEVVVKQFYDQKIETDDLLMYVVVVGKKSVVTDIVQKRALGRIELVKTHH